VKDVVEPDRWRRRRPVARQFVMQHRFRVAVEAIRVAHAHERRIGSAMLVVTTAAGRDAAVMQRSLIDVAVTS
jgi:hypothetical protein